MNIDPRKSEYSLVSYSPIKHEESDKLSRDVEAFVAQGGKIRNLSNNIHADPDYGLISVKMSWHHLHVAIDTSFSFFNVRYTV